METTASAKYKAKVKGSSIDMSNSALPLELHKMIVWVMHHPEEAIELLPHYNGVREEHERAFAQYEKDQMGSGY